MQDCVFAEWLLSRCDWNLDWAGKGVEWGRLAAELEPHKPLNGFALIGNDLCLPYQGNGHEAHKKNGKDENDNNIGLVNRKAEDAAKPSHGKSLLVLVNLPHLDPRSRVGNSACSVCR
jgi:hypothetical protein